jgi:hypothetical protein
MEIWCRFATVSSRVFDLVFYKTLFGNKYYIFVTLVNLCPIFVWYVCKLDSWAHILWAFDLTIKLGVIEGFAQGHQRHTPSTMQCCYP